MAVVSCDGLDLFRHAPLSQDCLSEFPVAPAEGLVAAGEELLRFTVRPVTASAFPCRVLSFPAGTSREAPLGSLFWPVWWVGLVSIGQGSPQASRIGASTSHMVCAVSRAFFPGLDDRPLRR